MYHKKFSSSRGGRSADGPTPKKVEQTPKKAEVNWEIGSLLREVRSKHLGRRARNLRKLETNAKLGITDCEYVASYNWVDGAQPVIMVPGCPPVYTPVKFRQLPSDSGEKRFRDNNGARYPKSPMEPGVRALLIMQPDFPSHSIDFFGCDNTIENLLQFASGLERSFRFDLELVGNTVFFLRKENSPAELIEYTKGYNLSFKESFTTWPQSVAGSVSHQRLIRYDFAGWKVVVVSEYDGYLKHKNPSGKVESPPKKKTAENDLILALEGVGVESRTPSASENLQIREQGEMVSQSSIFDHKTMKTMDSFDMTESHRRSWVNQTPNFIFAQNEQGLFVKEDIKIQDNKDVIDKWESDNQTPLHKFRAILKTIREIVEENRGDKLQVVRIGRGPLQICKQVEDKEVTALPHDLNERWASDRGAI